MKDASAAVFSEALQTSGPLGIIGHLQNVDVFVAALNVRIRV